MAGRNSFSKLRAAMTPESQARAAEKSRLLRKEMVHNERNELVPDRPVQELRGFLRGMDTEVERDEDRL